MMAKPGPRSSIPRLRVPMLRTEHLDDVGAEVTGVWRWSEIVFQGPDGGGDEFLFGGVTSVDRRLSDAGFGRDSLDR